jgi:hypothetical protein
MRPDLWATLLGSARPQGSRDAMTTNTRLKKTVRGRMARTGESYTAARAKIRSHAAATSGVLHVTNGDSAASSLKEALSTDVLPWRDVLNAGPVPSLPPAQLRLIRARFLAQRYGRRVGDVTAELRQRDRALLAHRGRYMLWFDPDLYDQLQLIQILTALRRNSVGAGSISLINPGEMIGHAHFAGLGELPPAALADLLPYSVTLVPETLALAGRAWSAFQSTNPTGMVAIASTADPRLRFLGEAFGRLLQEYPSVSDGLSLTERRALLAVADGARTARAAFRWVSERERRPFLGDVQFLDTLANLAAGEKPLLALSPQAPRPAGSTEVVLTENGRRVLASRGRYNGVDHWIGGVHLGPGLPSWRYDDRLETLVRTGGKNAT